MEKLREIPTKIKISRRGALQLGGIALAASALGAVGLGAKSAIEGSNLDLWLALWRGVGGQDKTTAAIKGNFQTQETLQLEKTHDTVATELFTRYKEGVKTADRQPIYELAHNKKDGEIEKLAAIAVLLTEVGSYSSYRHDKVKYLLGQAEDLVGYPSFRPGGELRPKVGGLTTETAAGIYRKLVQKIGNTDIDPQKLTYLLPHIIRSSEHLVCGEVPAICQRSIPATPTAEKPQQPSPTPTKGK